MTSNRLPPISSPAPVSSRFRELWDARKVFDGMPERNVVSWTAVLNGFLNMGLDDEVLVLFKEMVGSDVEANGLTFVCLLKFCGNRFDVDLGKQACGEARDLRLGKQLHGAVAKAKILESMPVRDVISWTAMISGYSSLGYGSEALKLLNDMLWDNVKPNMFTYSSALKACARLENANYGKWIHACVSKAKALENVFVGSSLIDMYMRCRDVADALRVFDEMPDRNSVTWKVMVIGYAKNGRCKEALKLMYRMQEEGFDVDNFVLATVLSACGDVQWESERASTCCLISGCVNETRK
ncbi:Pentatricopeptide repeat-containing protein [Ananas comosus]|uniref:Pentatricopeptide repeat-containing protein n=1 Tax=Ananas comosus TaxID=4615 RepID=A0A199V4Y9_ANACO|nr:Pentatricopeptide repeat-containing protein [Ananas comosus]